MIPKYNKVKHLFKIIMPSDIIVTLVYLAQEQCDLFVDQIKESNLPKTTQWDLIDLLKTARQHTEHAKQMGWIQET